MVCIIFLFKKAFFFSGLEYRGPAIFMDSEPGDFIISFKPMVWIHMAKENSAHLTSRWLQDPKTHGFHYLWVSKSVGCSWNGPVENFIVESFFPGFYKQSAKAKIELIYTSIYSLKKLYKSYNSIHVSSEVILYMFPQKCPICLRTPEESHKSHHTYWDLHLKKHV